MPVTPADTPIATVGYSAPVATPMRAVDAASRRSASRTSGRRRSSAAPSPTGSAFLMRGVSWHASTPGGKSDGARASSIASRYCAMRRRAR